MAGSTNDQRVTLEAGELRELAQAAREGGGDIPHDQTEFDAAGDQDRNKTKTRASRTAPLTERTKAKIRKLAREGKLSRNGVARAVGVSPTTVSRVCAETKPPITFDRSNTQAATQAKVTDLKAKRTELSEMFVGEVHRLVGLLVSPHEVIHWDKDGFVHRAEIERPTSADVKNYATAIGILTDKHLALIRHDSDDRDLPAVDKWLAAMLTGGAAS